MVPAAELAGAEKPASAIFRKTFPVALDTEGAEPTSTPISPMVPEAEETFGTDPEMAIVSVTVPAADEDAAAEPATAPISATVPAALDAAAAVPEIMDVRFSVPLAPDWAGAVPVITPIRPIAPLASMVSVSDCPLMLQIVPEKLIGRNGSIPLRRTKRLSPHVSFREVESEDPLKLSIDTTEPFASMVSASDWPLKSSIAPAGPGT